VPLNDSMTLQQTLQRFMSSVSGDEGEVTEGLENLEECLRQNKSPFHRKTCQGILQSLIMKNQ
jgi:hypothetical protein